VFSPEEAVVACLPAAAARATLENTSKEGINCILAELFGKDDLAKFGLAKFSKLIGIFDRAVMKERPLFPGGKRSFYIFDLQC
jgi:hypothetical protein